MVNIKFFPIDIDYKNNIRIFGKTIDNKKIVVIDPSLKPYFYAILRKESNPFQVQKKLETLREEDSFVVSTAAIKKKYFTNEIVVIKVFVNSSEAIRIIDSLAKKLPEVLATREADIQFYKKYLVDKQITPLTLCEVEGPVKHTDLPVDYIIEGEVKSFSTDMLQPKIMTFDIETNSIDNRFNEPILTIALVTNLGFKKVITWKPVKGLDYVEELESEMELLHRFKEIIREQSPDFLIGYYSDNFDFPYIEARARKNDIILDLGLDKSHLKIKKGKKTIAKIKGIVHIDLFQFIRRIMANSLLLDSYSLDVVAKELINEGKSNYNLDNIQEHWDSGNIKELCEYNLNDAIITLKLAEKILPNIIELVKITDSLLFDVSRMSFGQLVENYLIKKSREFNEIVPDKPSYGEISQRKMYTYKGASVVEPTPGLYEKIVVFDFKGFWPSILITKNICPSTLNKTIGNCIEIEEESGKVKYCFDIKHEGIIPAAVKDLVLRRNRVRELMKQGDNPILEARSYALKTIANSTYGYMGFFGARYYSRECVASITAFGREYISEVIKKTEQKGFKIIFSDTDSVAFALGDKDEEYVLKFLDSLNESLPGLMELELEGFYPRGIFVSKKSDSRGAKKKYALINQKEEIKIRGFETVRRDWSYVARETQKAVLTIILKDNSVEKAKEYTKRVILNILNKSIPKEKLIIKTQLKMNIDDYTQIGPHVAVARKLEEKGIYVAQGSTIEFIIIEGEGMIRDRAVHPNDYKEKSYDSEYYINNQVIPAVEKIFEIFNIKKEDLLEKNQSKLGEFIK